MWRAASFGVVIAVTAAAWAFLGVVIAAIVGPTGAYLVARRSTSGSVKNSDAATLFMELRENRKELIDEVRELRLENRGLRERVAVLENEVRKLGGHFGD